MRDSIVVNRGAISAFDARTESTLWVIASKDNLNAANCPSTTFKLRDLKTLLSFKCAVHDRSKEAAKATNCH